MSTIKFKYSKNAVNKAGTSLITDDIASHSEAKSVLDNWRACHIAPLNGFQTSLELKGSEPFK